MSIASEIAREVVFTDYECHNECRIEVVVSIHGGVPITNIRMPAYPNTSFPGAEDIRDPYLLRSHAACLTAAADEMERMQQK